jgi:hypothetical protein
MSACIYTLVEKSQNSTTAHCTTLNTHPLELLLVEGLP